VSIRTASARGRNGRLRQVGFEAGPTIKSEYPNNRRSNLRIVTRKANASHRPILNKNNTSGYRGVTRVGDKWRAQIKINGKLINLGDYKDVHEAGTVACEYRLANMDGALN
jgi:hypothetical protein